MRLFNSKKLVLTGIFGVGLLTVLQVDANAQSRREIERERQRIERENARYERERARRYRGSRNVAATRRSEQRIANSSYATGYENGLMAGEYDRRKGKFNQSNVYRDTSAYPSDGDPSSSDYVYRQGFLQGYHDGYNGIRNY